MLRKRFRVIAHIGPSSLIPGSREGGRAWREGEVHLFFTPEQKIYESIRAQLLDLKTREAEREDVQRSKAFLVRAQDIPFDENSAQEVQVHNVLSFRYAKKPEFDGSIQAGEILAAAAKLVKRAPYGRILVGAT